MASTGGSAGAIAAIKTPLAFFGAVVVIVATALAAAATQLNGWHQTAALSGAIGLPAVLVVAVICLAIWRPEALRGERPTAKSSTGSDANPPFASQSASTVPALTSAECDELRRQNADLQERNGTLDEQIAAMCGERDTAVNEASGLRGKVASLQADLDKAVLERDRFLKSDFRRHGALGKALKQASEVVGILEPLHVQHGPFNRERDRAVKLLEQIVVDATCAMTESKVTAANALRHRAPAQLRREAQAEVIATKLVNEIHGLSQQQQRKRIFRLLMDGLDSTPTPFSASGITVELATPGDNARTVRGHVSVTGAVKGDSSGGVLFAVHHLSDGSWWPKLRISLKEDGGFEGFVQETEASSAFEFAVAIVAEALAEDVANAVERKCSFDLDSLIELGAARVLLTRSIEQGPCEAGS